MKMVRRQLLDVPRELSIMCSLIVRARPRRNNCSALISPRSCSQETQRSLLCVIRQEIYFLNSIEIIGCNSVIWTVYSRSRILRLDQSFQSSLTTSITSNTMQMAWQLHLRISLLRSRLILCSGMTVTSTW